MPARKLPLYFGMPDGQKPFAVFVLAFVMSAVMFSLLGVLAGRQMACAAENPAAVVGSAVVTIRPAARAGQILDFREIKFNMLVMLCAQERCEEKIRVAREPYYENGTMRMVVNRNFLNQTISLADYGVIPYLDGAWNATNWLKRGE